MSNDLGYTLTRNNDTGCRECKKVQICCLLEVEVERDFLSTAPTASMATLCYKKLNYYTTPRGQESL